MKYTPKRVMLNVFYILLGFILIFCTMAGLADSYWSGMGGGLIGVGAAQLIRQMKYKNNEEYREKVDISVSDERNKFISNKAWAWAGYWFVLIMAVASILLKIAGYDRLVPFAAGSVCLIMVLYWLCWMYLSKKY